MWRDGYPSKHEHSLTRHSIFLCRRLTYITSNSEWGSKEERGVLEEVRRKLHNIEIETSSRRQWSKYTWPNTTSCLQALFVLKWSEKIYNICKICLRLFHINWRISVIYNKNISAKKLIKWQWPTHLH